MKPTLTCARLLVLGTCVLGGALLLLWRLRPSPGDPGSVKVLAIKAAAADPKAIVALRNLGSNAVPSLVKLLEYQDPFFRVRAWALAPMLPKQWSRALTAKVGPLEAPGVRAAAGKSLALLGNQAAEAVPDLLRALRDPEPFITMQAAAALGQIGKPSVPGLGKALSDTKPAIRRAAAYGLGEAGFAAKAAVPQLIHSLEDRDAQVRDTSAYSLSLIGNQVIAGLSNVIAHADSAERQSAARELVQFCQTLRGMTTLASKMEHMDDEDSRRVAFQIFGSIRVTENGAIRTLNCSLEDPDARVRLAAVQGLGLLNARTQAVVAGLRKRLQDSSPAVREWAALDLGKIGPAAGPATGDLKLAAQDNEPGVRAAAREALEKIELTFDKR